jgi:hypothetical protein
MLKSYCLAWLNTVDDTQILEMVRGGREVLEYVANGRNKNDKDNIILDGAGISNPAGPGQGIVD